MGDSDAAGVPSPALRDLGFPHRHARVDLALRKRLIIGAAIAGAVVAGWQIANGSFGGVAVVSVGLLFLGHRWLGASPDALVAAGVVLGYLVGNRGFAQLHPPNLPLLPAEFALGVALVFGGWRWANRLSFPVRRDALNISILVWIAVSAIRLPFDFRTYGVMAVRDFAMIYYALFFFLAQEWGREPVNRRWLERALTLGFVLAAPVALAFLRWPDWFATHLLVNGVPLIFVKGDVAAAFIAAATFWLVDRYVRHRRPGWLVAAVATLLALGLSNSRAAVIAFLVGMGWMAALRQWRALTTLAALLAVGLLTLGVQAAVTREPVTTTPIYRLYEGLASVVDVTGTRTYQSADLGDKPDNNQFRLVWWRTVIDETRHDGPWLGLGFGGDLAEEFVQLYYGEASEEFSARSPHNFLLSVFARTGTVGFLLFLAVLAAMARRTWRAGQIERASPTAARTLPFWLAAWAIFVSACFGVVLEGPMGAVVFWVVLGLANAPTAARAEAEPAVAASVPASV
jgi:O-antigen ligase